MGRTTRQFFLYIHSTKAAFSIATEKIWQMQKFQSGGLFFIIPLCHIYSI